MKETLKRLTCMLLALIMVAGMFPVSVFAEAENPISVDEGSTVSNVIGPIGAPETSQEPVVQTPVEEVIVEESVEEIPETPAFDPAEPIKYQVVHGETFSVRSVLTNAGVSVDTVTNVTGEMSGLVAATNTGDDWRLTPFNYFDALELSVAAKKTSAGDEAVYTLILSNRDPAKPLPRPAVTLTETVDGTVITVDAPEGAFPEGIRIRAVKADPAKVLVKTLMEGGYDEFEAEFAANAILESGMDLSPYIQGFTLSFYLPEAPDVEIEPEVDVSVTFTDMTLSAESIEVFHVTDEEVETVTGAKGSGDEVIFNAPAFTEYFGSDAVGLLKAAGPIIRAARDAIAQAILAKAKRLYGENGQPGTETPVTAKIERTTDPVYAGGNVQFHITFTFHRSAYWGEDGEEGYPAQMTLFDTYKNNTVTLWMPAGLLLTSSGGYDLTSTEELSDGSHLYTFKIEDISASGDNTAEFDVTAYVCNNGTVNSIETYTMSDATHPTVHISTEFDILDKRTATPEEERVLGTLGATADKTATTFTTSTLDKWGVKKTAASGSPVVDEANNKVTFTWTVAVGMLSDPTDPTSVTNEPAYYTRNGRVALDPAVGMKLTDAISATCTAPGVTLDNPTTTITKGSYSQSFSSGTEIALSGNLALDTVKVDADGDAPTYSKEQDVIGYTEYTVTTVYDIKPGMIAKFYDNTAYTLDPVNDAQISYKLAKVDPATSPVSEATQQATLPVTKPAKLTISKDLVTSTGTAAYSDSLYGAIEYLLTSTSASTFKVYEKDSTGNYIAKKFNGVEDVSSASLAAGGPYYLLYDVAYKVEENLTDDQSIVMKLISSENTTATPAQDEDWQVKFTNRDTLGTINITKKDDTNLPVESAEFTLYGEDGTPFVSPFSTIVIQNPVTTGNYGTISFNNLPVGTYTMDETTIPGGYAPDSVSVNGVAQGGFPITITISADDNGTVAAVAVSAVNKRNKVPLTLNKYIGISENPIPTDSVHLAPDADFPTGTFTLQRTTTPEVENSWTDVTGNDLNNKPIATGLSGGQIKATLPAFDGTNIIYYRFKETIPSGYYVTQPTTQPGTAYSEVFTLVDPDDATKAAESKEVNMFNRRYVNLRVYKNFYDVESDGSYTYNSTQKTTARIYWYVGTQPTSAEGLHQFGTSQTIGGGSDIYATWSNLPLYDSNGQEIHYLIEETDVGKYLLDSADFTTGDSDATIVTIDNKKYVELNFGFISNSAILSTRLYNTQQLVPVIMYKRNSYTNAQNITGTKFTVWVYDESAADHKGAVAKDADTGLDIEDIEIPGPEGKAFYLEPGKKYVFEETYYDNTVWRFDYYSDDGEIDLSAIEIVDHDVGNRVVRYIYNKPFPNIKITKIDSTTNATNDTLKTAVFTVYEKDGDIYKPLKNSDNQNLTITATGEVSGVRLEPGTYYVSETTVPAGYVDPNKDYAMYDGVENYVRGTDDQGTERTFYEITVEDMEKSGTSDNICEFSFKNIPNTGTLKVTKYVDGKTGGNAKDFSITVTGSDGKTYTKKTTNSGSGANQVSTATFELPVFDSNGDRIEYTITETLSTSQQQTYYKVFDDQKTTVILGQTITHVVVKNGDTYEEGTEELRVENATLIDLEVKKKFQHKWYGTSYYVQDAGIGLYELSEDRTEWVYVNKVSTDSAGAASFSDMRRDRTYAVVELSCPEDWMLPYQDSNYKTFPNNTNNIPVTDPTDPASALSAYNAWVVSAETLATITPASGATRAVYSFSDLINTNHWVQFDVFKYKDKEVDRNLTVDEFYELYNPDNAYEFPPVDNVVFKLYRYVLGEDQTSVAFSEAEGSGWSLVGTYSSGTAYNAAGARLEGEFLTDIDMNIDENYVYMLVEVSVGPNSGLEMNENFRYTFWHEKDRTVTCTSPSTYIDRGYTMDTVNRGEVLNNITSGPGTGEIYIASFRISKWQDTFGADGQPNQAYTPLRNAKFELYLSGTNTLISELTSGKKEGDYAVDQSGAFVLEQITVSEDGTKFTAKLREYEDEENPSSAATGNTYDVTGDRWQTDEGYIVYGVPVTLKEVSAPDGYSYFGEPLESYLCFVDIYPDEDKDGQYWYFSDAYFLLTTNPDSAILAENQAGRSWYATGASSSNANITVGSDRIRIVDYPIENTLVIVHKIGYKPTEANKGMTSIEKYEDPDIDTPSLGGVTMALDRLMPDGTTWKTWDADADDWGSGVGGYTFTTNTEGSIGTFMFPHGLPKDENGVATYRIYEVSLGADNEDKYEMAYPDVDHARQFQVGGVGMTVYMANPEKPDMTVKKTDMTGNEKLTGAVFKLNPVNSQGKEVTSEAGTETGTYLLNNISTGYYTLSETEAPTNYTGSYLSLYLQTLDEPLNALASANGLHIGYDYTVTDGNDKDVVINTINPSANDIELTVKDPGVGEITINKKDDKGNLITSLPSGYSIRFYQYYYPFQNFEGTEEVPIPTFSSYTEPSNGWVYRRYNAINNNTGTLSWTGLYPGVYAIREELRGTSPTYDKLYDTAGNEVVYYLVVKGGLDITVTGLPENATIYEYDDDTPETTTTVKTLYDSGDTISCDVMNREKVTLKAKKNVELGDLANLTDTNVNWTITLTLYEEDKTTVAGAVRINQGTNQGDGITFKTVNNSGAPTTTDALFTQGKKYYLGEVVTNPANGLGFEIATVLKDGTEVPAGTDGMYEFVVDSIDGYTISVTNNYLWGKFIFSKYDEEEIGTVSPAMNGATFEVRYKDENGDWVVLDKAKVSQVSTINGAYFIDIPLVSKDPTDYYIFEKTAPDGYIKDENQFLKVTLSFTKNTETGKVTGNVVDWRNSTTADQYFTNSKGRFLTVTKYDNIHGVSANKVGTENPVGFTIYEKGTGEDAVWTVIDQYTTNADGIVQYLCTPGYSYAVKETNIGIFRGQDSVYRVDKDGVEIEKLTATTIKVNGEDVTDVYVFDNVSAPIYLYAYNKPLLKPMIVKRDAGGYPTDVIPTMSFAIYEVPDNFEKTDASVTAFLETAPSPVYTGSTSTESKTADGKGTQTEWYDQTHLEKCWDPAKTYLVVETKVTGSVATYNTLNKDDSRVVWYELIPKYVVDSDKEGTQTLTAPTVTLYNVNGYAEAGITKAVVNNSEAANPAAAADTDNASVGETVESLFKGDRKVVYTVTPSVNSVNQALAYYKVADTGLTFDPASATVSYEITKVLVGAAPHHDVTNLDYTIGDSTISAKVTFDVGVPVIVNNISTATEVTPTTSGATSFVIDYYCDDVRTATGYTETEDSGYVKGYSLGQDFEVEASTVYATVKKVTTSKSSPAVEVSSFKNKATVDYGYPKWKDDGSGTELVQDTLSDTAKIKVNPIEYPKVKIEKTSDSAAGTTVEKTVKYSITITNSGDPALPFVNPVILDTLPVGVSYKGNAAVQEGAHGETFTILTAQPIQGGETSQTTTGGGGTMGGTYETAVRFDLEGTLEPGSYVTITFDAYVEKIAAMYSRPMENEVYLSSTEHSYYIVNKNPNGYSFQNENGYFPTLLSTAAQGVNNSETTGVAYNREQKIEPMLGDYAGAEFGWIGTFAPVPLNDFAGTKLSKGIKGDQDTTYSDKDGFIATATRTNSNSATVPSPKGEVDYRLTILNGNTSPRYQVVVADVISKIRDGRSTIWSVDFDSIISVENAGTTLSAGAGGYYLFYYTGTIDTALAAVQNAYLHANGWNTDSEDHPAWPNRSDTELPSGWSSTAPADMTKVTAIALVFDSTVVLEKNTQLVIKYHTFVSDMNVDKTFFENYAFENAYNEFYMNWVNGDGLLSNRVAVTVLDGLVSIEGDVWIDEDWDGEQKNDGNRRDYTQYAIVNQLADAIGFSITDKRNNGGSISTDDKGGNNTSIGESIKHFRFDKLGPGLATVTDPYTGEDLNVSVLKGDDPYNYILNAELSDTTDTTVAKLLQIFELTVPGEHYFWSDQPDHLNTDPDVKANALDDNFIESAQGEYVTKRFYIPYSENVDQSKDIGFRMVRDLIITKVAQDNPNVKIEGAEFQIYGPFNEDGASAAGVTSEKLCTFDLVNGVYVYNFDGTGAETTLVTDANGQISVSGINWWKEYIIKEVSAGSGYEIAGATAGATTGYETSVAPIVGEDGAFVVKIPSTDRVTKPDGVTIANPRGVPEVPYVKKVIEGTPLEDETFEFTLDFAEDMDVALKQYVKFKNANTGEYEDFTVPQTKTLEIKANGAGRTEPFFDAIDVASDDFDETTLKKIWFLVKGTYKFVITETKGDNTNYAYDPAMWYYTVTVDLVDGQLVATHTYTYKENADADSVKPQDQTAAKFTNKYTPKPVDGNLKVKKVIDGTQIPDFKERTDLDVTFEFELKPVGDAPMTRITRKPDGTETTTSTAPVKVYIKASEAAADPVDFGLITFTKAGTYQYTITETADVNGDYPWFTFDPTTITATVTVEPDTTAKPGKLKISNIEYEQNVWTSADDNTTAAKFTNTYTPGEVPFTATAQKTFKSYTGAKFTFTFELYQEINGADTKIQEKKIYNVSGDPVYGTITLEPVSFDAVTITGAGVYTFKVKEQALDEKTKVICSEEVYTYVVTASWDTATRKLIISKMDVTDKEGNTVESPYYAEFINEYDLTAYWPPVVSKVLTGRPMETDEVFEFVVEKGSKKVADGTFNATGIVSVTYYEEDGTTPYTDQPSGVPFTIADVSRSPYTYTIKEINRGDTAQTGITYDGNPITATVNITEERDNEDKPYLEVTANYSPDAQFENTFNASGEWTPEATKELTGRELKKDEFTFVLEVKQEDGTWKSLQTVKNNADGTIPFTAITYNEQQTGSYEYRIIEVVPDPNDQEHGMIYAGTPVEYEVTVALHKNSDGTYSKDLDVDDDLKSQSSVFINTFNHDPITSTLLVQKKITGQWPTKVPAETFTFEMTLTSGNADNVKLKDGDNYVAFSKRTVPLTPAELNTYVVKSFDDIWFMNAGEYVFTVKEEEGSDPHFAYDPSVYTWTVKVTKDTAGTGQLSKTEELKKGEEVIPGDPLTVSFDNPYTPEPVEVPFKVKKILDGETMSQLTDTQLKAITFTFVLEEHGGNTNKDGYELPKDPADMTVQISAYEILKEGVNFKEFPGKVKFTEASPVDEDGKPIPYIFTIHEEDTQGPDGTPSSRIYHDSTTWYVSVVIVDNSGKLEVEKDYPEYKATGRTTSYGLKDGIAYFTNTYSPDKTQYTPKVKKVMDGDPRVPKIERDFTFDLTWKSAVDPDGADIPDGYYYVDPQGTTVVVHDQGTAPFTEIVFKKIGTYIFEIKERDDGTEAEKKYYVFDLAPRYLRVVVSDRGDGSLKCDARYFKDEDCTEPAQVQANIPEIINEYHPLPAKYAPPIEKTLITNYGPTVTEKKFTFTLKALTSVPNDGSSGGSTMLPGTTEELTVWIPKGETVVPDDQTKTFGEITYTKPGEYKYLITETIVNEHGISCSTVNWTLTVTVTDGGGQLVAAHLYEPSSGPDTANTEQAKFKNDYKPEPTEYTPEVTKKVPIDFGPTVEKKFFYFTAKLMSQENIAGEDITGAIYRITDYQEFADENNPNPLKAIQTKADVYKEPLKVEVPAGTTAATIIPGVFEQLKFVKAGTYIFEIIEKEEDEEGITYDKTVWTLTVVVRDKDGKLEVETHEYVPNPKDADHVKNNNHADFTNPYEPTPTKYQPEVDKTMTFLYGPTVEEKTFKFDLKLTGAERKDEKPDGTTETVDVTDGASLTSDTATVKVPAGKESSPAKFKEIEFSKAGTYTFEIKEQDSGVESITDDTAVWTLVVEIKDTDGKLEVASTKYTSDDETTPESNTNATFVNPYKPKPTDYAPEVEKNIDLITGAPTSLDKTFTFYLEFISAMAKDGTDVSDGQLDAAEADGGVPFEIGKVEIKVPAGETDGKAKFNKIYFTKAGTYAYRITEKETLPPELGMVYDGSVWILKVVVEDQDGELKVTRTSYTNDPTVKEVSPDSALFVNPYRTGNLRVEKRVSGNGASTFTKFTFKVDLYVEELLTGSLKPLEGEYPVEIYESKGNIIETATVVNGTVTFKLRHNQYAIIKNIPVGVKWEVTEEKSLGYSSSAETPNSGTIGLVENVSKWKNHRSTVPPIPRTGYGDGTTVKVGLGASLGVFLASAIGSILQSKNSKKKKRGGGSHAAE